ncbi:hypothetical protein PFISCL1PPCAC_14239, partial [Pristionchus fissidentatus]
IVVASLAISSVLITLVCLAINARRRRMTQQLPDLIRAPPIIFAPPSQQIHPSAMELPTYYITQNGVPKPINLDAPPTYEEAMSAPTSPVPLASPGGASASQSGGISTAPIPRTRLSIEIERNAMQQRLSSTPPEDRPSTSRV